MFVVRLGELAHTALEGKAFGEKHLSKLKKQRTSSGLVRHKSCQQSHRGTLTLQKMRGYYPCGSLETCRAISICSLSPQPVQEPASVEDAKVSGGASYGRAPQ